MRSLSVARRARPVALAAVAALALALAGCSGSVNGQQAVDAAGSAAVKVGRAYLGAVDTAQDVGESLGRAIADGDLSDVDVSTFTKVVVTFAGSGKEIGAVEDAAAIRAAFSQVFGPSGRLSAGSAEGLEPEYAFEVRQQVSAQVGADGTEYTPQASFLTVTTYKGSDVVRFTVLREGFPGLTATAPHTFVTTLRQMAEGLPES